MGRFEPLELLLGQRQADQAARVARHEVDRLGRHELGGDARGRPRSRGLRRRRGSPACPRGSPRSLPRPRRSRPGSPPGSWASLSLGFWVMGAGSASCHGPDPRGFRQARRAILRRVAHAISGRFRCQTCAVAGNCGRDRSRSTNRPRLAAPARVRGIGAVERQQIAEQREAIDDLIGSARRPAASRPARRGSCARPQLPRVGSSGSLAGTSLPGWRTTLRSAQRVRDDRDRAEAHRRRREHRREQQRRSTG